jgi:hypothetical protein
MTGGTEERGASGEMRMKYKPAVFLACGFLLVLLGAMPLNGYILFRVSPAQFHQNEFLGSVTHLLIGVIPVLSGIVLLVLGSDRAWKLLCTAFVGVGLGLLGAASAFIQAEDRTAFLPWLAIVAASLLAAVAARAVLNLWASPGRN